MSALAPELAPALVWADLFSSLGRVEGDRFVERTPRRQSLMPAPRFTFGPVPAELNRFYYSETAIYRTGCFFLRDAGVAADGIPYRDGALLTDAAVGFTADYFTTRLGGAMPARIRHEAGRAISLTGPGYLIYGHWLVDILPKLHLLQLLGIDLARETLLLPEDTPEFGLAWLRALGIHPGRIVTYHPTDEIPVFDELVVPFPLRTNSRTSPLFAPAAQHLVARLTGLAGRPSPVANGRIYLSRQRSGRMARLLSNWEGVEELARQYGYTVVYPETMSLPDQLAMFGSARMVMGQYGSAMHGTMFAPAGCAVCALRGTLIDPGFLQTGLCDVAGQPLGYVLGASGRTAEGNESFAPDLADVQAALHAMNVLAG